MRAVVCPELGPLSNLRIEERRDLVPGPDQVVIDVAAAGVNYVDGLICQGRYQIKPPTPYTPGSEVAGLVAAVGDGARQWAPGDRVLVSCGAGGFASQLVVNAQQPVRVPAAIDLAQAATLVQSYATALYTLTRRTHVAEGEWVLVLGAGGGVGLAMIDLAKALGAHVIAAASTEDKLAAAVTAGADATIAYETEDLKARAREIGDGGVDVVVDPVGGRFAEEALRALRWMGRYCVIGFAAGPIPTIPLNHVLLNNRTVVGVDWGASTFRDPAGQADLLAELLTLVDAERLHPAAPTERPLDDVAAVLADLAERRVAGKVVLVP
ncbi:MAG TPA: NADPH:quinone oxidoreductase family protein [Mycobacteriales bacterium]